MAAVAVLCVAAGWPSSNQALEQLPDGTRRLLSRAASARPERYRFAQDQGARLVPTRDGGSFFLVWLPPAGNRTREGAPDEAQLAEDIPVIVTLHGSQAWAFDEFFLWHPFVEKRHYGLVALQWWTGRGEAYTSPHAMYPQIEAMLSGLGVKRGRVLLHGFSRGAANTYALAWLDRWRGSRWFGMILANAGGASEDYPPNAVITSGRFGPDAFEDTRWVLFCGGRDPHPDRDGCPAMARTRSWLMRFEGRVERVIEDPEAGHGGFHQQPEHVTTVLELFDELMASSERSGA